MSDELPATLDAEQVIREIIAAYQAARATGQSYDLEAVLAREPALAEAVRARLGLTRRDTPPPKRPTVTMDPNTPRAERGTLTFGSGGSVAPPGPGDFGDYELLEEIARGGMGVVLRAREKNLNRVVALKMILAGRLASPEDVRRFCHEAEEASRLDHPNIVPIYHIGEYGGQHYYTMKFIKEGTLREQDHGPKADLRKVAHLVAQVAHAVHYAHRHGILHRDIKPGNILIDTEGRPHVTDFGLAKPLSGPAGQTQSGAILGTPGYMSPEQAAARKDLTTATDVYSIGAVLYDLVTGRPPFDAGSALDTLLKVLEQEPVPPHRLNPRVDRDLETICLCCLNKDPRRRYPSAEALARDLEHYLAGEPIRARRIGRLERTAKWVRRRPLAAALVGVLTLATLLLAVGGWVFSARLQAAVHEAQEARDRAEFGEREADRKRQQVNDYLVYLNERLANLNIEQPIRLEFLHQGLALCEQFRQGHVEDAEACRQTAQLYRCLGELEQERRDPKKAAEAYERARGLLEQLAADLPDVPLYRHDLAVIYAKQAHLQETSGEHAQALETLKRAAEVQDQLAAEPDAPLSYRQSAAGLRLTLGAFLEEQKKPAEAEAAYRDGLGRAEKLAAERDAPAAVHQEVASTAGTLAWLLLETKPAETEDLLQRCLREWREARGLQSGGRELSQALLGAYADLAALFGQRGRHADLAALANQLRADFLGEPEQTYQAVRLLVDAVRAAAGQKDLPAPQRDALAEEYGIAAVAMLDKAIKEGFASRARVEVDPDLDPLRPRKDFGEFMADLERRYPTVSADQELAALQGLFDHARRTYTYQMEGARTQAERQRALAVKPNLQVYAEKFLQFARKRRDSASGLEALVRVLENCEPDEVGPAAADIRKEAARLLEQDHFQKQEFGSACLRFVRADATEIEHLLKEAMRRHPQREVRGLAGLTVATNLARAGIKARQTDPKLADERLREAEQELERLLKEYGTVQVGRSSLGEVARYELDEVRYLSVGSQARDIAGQDLKGRPLKLSDCRGKVVVIDFWADWCGFCREMYPQEKELVQRFQGKPFELVGINCDDDRDAVCHTVARKGLNWPSLWDGGPDGGRVRRDWHVGGFPTIWVLDHRHVIRFKGVRGKALDDAVAELVKAAENEQVDNRAPASGTSAQKKSAKGPEPSPSAPAEDPRNSRGKASP